MPHLLQLAFRKFHNKLIDEFAYEFEETQRQARFHYQHIVLHDFLKQVSDPTVYRFAFERLYRNEEPLFHARDSNGDQPMPEVVLKFESIGGWKTLKPAVWEEIRESTPLFPLFFYLLRKPKVIRKGAHLDTVASAISMELFGGILSLCSETFLSDTRWSPSSRITGNDQQLSLADLLRYVERY